MRLFIVADYFTRQQDELRELAARSSLISLEIDTTAMQSITITHVYGNIKPLHTRSRAC